MKFQILLITVCAAFLLVSCAGEKAENKEPSAEKMSLKVKKTKVEASDKVATPTAEVKTDEKEGEKITEAKTKTEVKPAPVKTVAATKNQNNDKVVTRPKKTAGFAELSFKNSTYDFGTIEQGDIVKHTFDFVNTGTGDLIITDATATCGCTRPDFPFLPIPPQGTGKVNVTFNSTGKIGPQRKPVTLISNSRPKRMKVYFVGTVVEKSKITKKVVPEIDTTSSQ